MKIFVAGATGVIGSRVIPLLVSAGHQVTAVGRTPDKRAALEQQGATGVEVDLFDPESLRGPMAGHEVVINLATSIPPTWRMFLPGAWGETDHIRRDASANLVDAAIAGGVKRFIQESFAPTYPDSGDRWIDESVPLQPTKYNRTVLDAEASANRFTQSGGVGIVMRFAWFYGTDPQTQDIMRFARMGWVAIPGSPDAYFSPVSHEDAAAAVFAALDVPAGAYNVVDNEPLPRRDYFRALAEALDVQSPKFPPHWITPVFGSLGDLMGRSLRISNHKLREASAWQPKYPSVREGWPAMVAALHQPA
jgi:nucleoside-diphosphate-sugar epimerase